MSLTNILEEINNNIIITSSNNYKSILFYDISSNIYNDISNNIFYNPIVKDYISNCLSNFAFNFPKEDGNYLYAFLLDKEENNKPLLKIGYTANITDRNISLKIALNCNLYLLYWKIIDGEYQEKEFHKFLQTKYKNLHFLLKKKDKIYKEIYLFHPNIMDLCVMYEFPIKNLLSIEQEKTKQIELQEKTKQIELQEKTKQIETIERTKQEQEKTKQLIYQLKILKFNK